MRDNTRDKKKCAGGLSDTNAPQPFHITEFPPLQNNPINIETRQKSAPLAFPPQNPASYPVIPLFKLHFPQSASEVVARDLLHVVEFEELISPMPVHIDENVAMLIRRQHLTSGAGHGHH